MLFIPDAQVKLTDRIPYVELEALLRQAASELDLTHFRVTHPVLPTFVMRPHEVPRTSEKYYKHIILGDLKEMEEVDGVSVLHERLQIAVYDLENPDAFMLGSAIHDDGTFVNEYLFVLPRHLTS